MAAQQTVDKKLLKTLKPLETLANGILDEIAAKATLQNVPAGTTLFREGEKDNRYIYVVSGAIALSSAHGSKDLVKAKTANAEQPLSHHFPRPMSAKAKVASTILVIDADLLDFLMSDADSPPAAIEVTEISSDEDEWMLSFMQSPAFLKLPTENLQKLLMSMEEIHAKKGDVIIRQGTRDDYYYILKSGRVTVSRRPNPEANDITLAILEEGAGFGEEALITDTPRNASIIMRDNGSLIRLQKNVFLKLMVEPLLHSLNSAEVKSQITAGALLIDVRSPTIVRQHPVTGAVNIPMSMLRLKFDTLKPGRNYLLICEDGNQSKAAAFLMIRQGLTCHIVKDGIHNEGLSVANLDKLPKVQARPASQYSEADKQKLAAQQKQAEAARIKAEQEIAKRKAELAAAQQRAQQESQQAASKAAQMKVQAEQELARAQAEAEANRRREAELQQAAMQAENLMQETQELSAKARHQAEQEAAAIRARAVREAERLRAEVEEARRQLSIDAARARQQEADALKVRQEAEAIKQAAMSEAASITAEIHATRDQLRRKLASVEAEEAHQRANVLAEARKRAEEVALLQTRQAEQEAVAIKRAALEEAQRLQAELQQTRQQIEAEAARAISQLKLQATAATEQAQHAEDEYIPEIIDIVDEMEAPQEEIPMLAESKPDLSSVFIPMGNSSLLIDDDTQAMKKAESIKQKLQQADSNRFANTFSEFNQVSTNERQEVKVSQHNNKVVLEGEEDIFIFRKPSREATPRQQKTTAHKQEQEQPRISENKPAVNPFLVNNEPAVAKKPAGQVTAKDSDFMMGNASKSNNKVAPVRKPVARKPAAVRHSSGTGRWAIAAMLLLAIGGSVTALHVLKVIDVPQIIARLTGDSNTAVAGESKKKRDVMRASKEKGVKEGIENKFDKLMKGWKDTLSEMENPKKK